MALKRRGSGDAGKGGGGGDPTELRLARRYLLALLLLLPLGAALAGFGVQQRNLPAWPEAPREEPARGRILAADGTILAEGEVEGRRYPQGELAAHIVGFSGKLQPHGGYGLEGLEHAAESVVAAGRDVVTTLDPTLQAIAEAELAAAVRGNEAESGTVVILEAGSGRVLAAASHPTFDPNAQGRYPRSAIRNRAFLQQYEPGSVMKPFVVAALLEDGRLSTAEAIPAEPYLRVGDKTFYDVARHPDRLLPRDVLRYSSNTAMLHLTERFEPWELHGWLERYGFGQELGFGSAATRSGDLRDWRTWVPQDQASITIGQSVSTTALQLAAAYSIFANDGVLVAPRLVEDEEVAPPRRVLSSATAAAVRAMLVHTVEESGLRTSRIPGVPTAGKTGTADVFDAATGSYVDGDYALTFAGIFPADAPRAVMVVSVQKPRLETSSTYVAAPLFRAIGSEVVAHWGLAPNPSPVAAGPR